MNTGKIAQGMRNALPIAVFIAGLAALLLIVQDQQGVQISDESAVSVLAVESAKRLATSESAVKVNDPAVKLKEPVNPEAAGNRVLAEFLAKRYQVSQDVTFDLVGIAQGAGKQLGLDPLLIMAIIAVESRYNPIAESVAGAKGLMQIIPKYHGDKLGEFGGEKAVFDPATNILVGSRILKEYIGVTGNLGMALQMYAGALNDEQDVYTTRVMGEKQRLQQVVGRHAGRTIQTKSTGSASSSSSSPL
jgi:soluble lytic murein transglycosylase-like protein